jgi:ABC-type Fe3+-hydroxamate transport system substrate-binding protein
MRKKVLCVLVMVLLASAVPLAITPAAADLYYEIPGDVNPHDDKLTKDELTRMILPYMLDKGDSSLDDIGDAAYVYAYWNGEPKTVMEANDREVTFYRPVERVVTTFAMCTRAVVMVGGCDKLVGLSHGCILPEEEHACGGVLKIQEIAMWGANPEQILSLKPDVLVGNTRGEDPEIFQEKIQALMVYAGAEFAKTQGSHAEECMCAQLEFTGEVLDTQEKAEEVVSLVYEKCGLVTGVVLDIPHDERPKACLVSGKGMVSKVRSYWGTPFYEAGALTILEDLGAREISVEQLIDWNPDYLFITNSGSRGGTKAALSLTIEQVLEDPRLQTINAVKNGSVYYITGNCNYRPFQRIIVGMLYMAKIFYPGELKDLDLEKEGNELFKAFYGDDGLYTEFADDLGYLREFIEESKE